jgi:pimeloyl-ACP methyl ester carboxylesterase
MTQAATMTSGYVNVNGVKIAFRVQGEGPPLVLIMGYRLNSIAWPVMFIDVLKRSFTVITLDNRGTGRSDKPLTGYALANMARDVAALLDEIDIESTYVLGYSMGGAIAQEFVRQFPDRVTGLILCATMCGGPRATYAEPSVVRVMRDLDGLSTEQIARQIWQVTYAPHYLEQNLESAEDQMRREIALPTPLHAADLQFQAFAEFDGSRGLSQIKCPTLVLTGDLDELIPPQNSKVLATLIPDAKLVVIPGGGHRVLWEAVDDCTTLITEFLTSIRDRPVPMAQDAGSRSRATVTPHILSSIAVSLATWPLAIARARFETVSFARQLMLVGSSSRFGDGKPVVILGPRLIGSDLMLLPLSAWLKALGYRAVTANTSVNPDDLLGDNSLSQAVRDITRRVGRKAVLITHSSSMTRALRTASAHKEWISDVVVFDAPYRSYTDGLRIHFISFGWSALDGLIELPRLLRNIGIELINEPEFELRPSFGRSDG